MLAKKNKKKLRVALRKNRRKRTRKGDLTRELAKDATDIENLPTVERVTGRTVPATEEPRRPGDPPTLIGSAGKIRQVLEWQPAIPDLAEIIETAWRWYGKIPGNG